MGTDAGIRENRCKAQDGKSRAPQVALNCFIDSMCATSRSSAALVGEFNSAVHRTSREAAQAR